MYGRLMTQLPERERARAEGDAFCSLPRQPHQPTKGVNALAPKIKGELGQRRDVYICVYFDGTVCMARGKEGGTELSHRRAESEVTL